MKNKIYNLIVLDESGSMHSIWNQTISGCNETINVIRAAQQKFDDTQENLVSIYAFQEGSVESRYILKNEPALKVDHISRNDYVPGGCTPLYDALGKTLNDLKALTKEDPTAIANVTIITDGWENASREFTREEIAKMIDALKEMGWSFNFIGANIDVKQTASSLNIDNSMEFQQDEAGTRRMFYAENACRMRWHSRSSKVMADMAPKETDSEEERKSFYERMKEAAANYFGED